MVEFVDCSICKSSKPTAIMSCLKHVACDVCVNNNEYCVCRNDTTIPLSHIKNIIPAISSCPKNEVGNMEQFCSWCEEAGESHIATVFCPTCELHFCKECRRGHQRQPTSRGHTVQELILPKHGRMFNNECCLHPGESMEVYCNTCNELTCRDCQLSGNHVGHTHQWASAKCNSLMGDIRQLLDNDLQSHLDGSHRKSEQLLKTRQQCISQSEDAKNTFDTCMNRFRDALEAWYNRMKKDFNNKVKAVRGRLDDDIEKCYAHQKELEQLKKLTKLGIAYSIWDDKSDLSACGSGMGGVRILQSPLPPPQALIELYDALKHVLSSMSPDSSSSNTVVCSADDYKPGVTPDPPLSDVVRIVYQPSALGVHPDRFVCHLGRFVCSVMDNYQEVATNRMDCFHTKMMERGEGEEEDEEDEEDEDKTVRSKCDVSGGGSQMEKEEDDDDKLSEDFSPRRKRFRRNKGGSRQQRPLISSSFTINGFMEEGCHLCGGLQKLHACCMCKRYFHNQCHVPFVEQWNFEDDENPWMCSFCCKNSDPACKMAMQYLRGLFLENAFDKRKMPAILDIVKSSGNALLEGDEFSYEDFVKKVEKLEMHDSDVSMTD